MKHIFSLLIIILCFSSCNIDKKTEISVTNNTSSIIDSLKITYGTEKENKKYLINNVNSGLKVKALLDMNLKGVDGGYFLEIFQKEKKIEKYFGYYSNAVFKNYIFDLKIEKDTLLINKNLVN